MVVSAPVQLDINNFFKARYDNFIGGKWVPPTNRRYSDNLSPVTGRPICQVANSTVEDVELALLPMILCMA